MRKLVQAILLVIIIVVYSLLYSVTNVKAEPMNQTVEGEGNHYVTGESYPSKIEVIGYDVINDKYYLNFELAAKDASAKFAYYYIDLFNEAGLRLGGEGTYALPVEVTPLAVDPGDSLNKIKITNKSFTLGGDLTAEYNLIITVKETSVTDLTP